MCRLGSYRLKSECKSCPNTAWLLFLMFALVIVTAVAIAVFLSKKKINFAGLSIGVDFLQVLSMFASFGFDWPPAIVSLFNAFSLINFNFELLAPECSLSLNYETKWFIVQSLPLLLFCGTVVVIAATRLLQQVQVRVFHTLPFGAMSALSLTDVCVGILISGIFLLYFGECVHCSESCLCTRLAGCPLPWLSL